MVNPFLFVPVDELGNGNPEKFQRFVLLGY